MESMELLRGLEVLFLTHCGIGPIQPHSTVERSLQSVEKLARGERSLRTSVTICRTSERKRNCRPPRAIGL